LTRLAYLLLAAVLALACWPAAAHAQDVGSELSDLRQRLEALERDNEALRRSVLERLPPIEQTSDVSYSAIADGDSSLAERVESLEAELKKQTDAAAKKKADDAKKPNQKWTGRVHTDYWSFPHASPGANAFENGDSDIRVQDRFLFRRLRLGIQGDIPDNMLYKLEVDFNNPNNPQLKDNYIGWQDLPLLNQLLVGNQKRPYGLDHLNSSRYNVFLERPDIVEAFNQDARRFGICSYGFSDDLAYNWRFGAYMSQDVQNLGIAQQTAIGEDYQAEAAGRFANTIWYDESSDGRGFAHWAVSGAAASTSPFDPLTTTARFQSRVEARTSQRWLDTGPIAGADHYELLGLEALVNVGPVQWVAEVEQVWMHRIGDPDLYFYGGYTYVSWFLTGENMTWDRETGQLGRVQPFENFFLVDSCDDCVAGGWGAWQVALRYSHADLSDENINGGIANELTFAMNWYWNPYSKMQFNAIYGEITDRRPIDGQTNAYFTILGTRFIVDF
jgi:phosphate-selective porin OprO/OprP